MAWCVYIIQCSDNTLYTGCTNDLKQRLAAHNQGQGAKYTRGRTPVKLKFCEPQPNRAQAQSREYEIKQLSRRQKQALIKGS
jgi:putative endonuclease